MNDQKRFLIIAPSWIGDLLMSQSVYKSLKNKYYNCTIDVIAKPYLNDLLKLMPEVNNVYNLDTQHREFGLMKRYKIAKDLRKNYYTSAIVLTNTFKSAIIPWLARIPERIGYKKELRSFLLTKSLNFIKHDDNMVNRYLKLINSSFSENIRPSLEISTYQNHEIKKKFLLNNNAKNIFLCPEAEFGETKRWPQKKWMELAKYFKEYKCNVYFLGKDGLSANAYNSVIDETSIVSLIGKTNLKEVAFLFSYADLVISNDSGLMHLSASLGRNLISIFGSSSPFYTPPLMKYNSGEVLYKQLGCSPCFKRTCPLENDNNLKCLNEISVEEVFNKSKPYLV